MSATLTNLESTLTNARQKLDANGAEISRAEQRLAHPASPEDWASANFDLIQAKAARPALQQTADAAQHAYDAARNAETLDNVVPTLVPLDAQNHHNADQVDLHPLLAQVGQECDERCATHVNAVLARSDQTCDDHDAHEADDDASTLSNCQSNGAAHAQSPKVPRRQLFNWLLRIFCFHHRGRQQFDDLEETTPNSARRSSPESTPRDGQTGARWTPWVMVGD